VREQPLRLKNQNRIYLDSKRVGLALAHHD